MFEDKLPCKTVLNLNAMAVKAANTHLCPRKHGVVVHVHVGDRQRTLIRKPANPLMMLKLFKVESDSNTL